MEFGAEFYQGPLAFDRLGEAPPAGDQSFRLDFISGPYEFNGLSLPQRQRAAEKYAALHFARSPTPQPPVRISFCRLDAQGFRDLDFSREVYRFDLDYGQRQIRIVGRFFFALLQPDNPADFCRVGLPPLNAAEFGLIFDNVFRTVMAYRMLACGGLLMHSGAVVREGDAYLFVGHSGAGKSTSSALSAKRGYKVLSDDMNAILPAAQGFVVEKIPYTGDFDYVPPRPERYPLRRILLIRQSDHHQLLSLGRTSAMARLLACAPYVNLDPWRQDALVNTMGRVLDAAPAATLLFRKDPQFWELITAAAAPGEGA